MNSILGGYTPSLQDRIDNLVKSKWSHTPESRLDKLSEEIVEFYEALWNQDYDLGYLSDETVEEGADIVITLMALFAQFDVDLLTEVNAKVGELESGGWKQRGWEKKILIANRQEEKKTELAITVSKV